MVLSILKYGGESEDMTLKEMRDIKQEYGVSYRQIAEDTDLPLSTVSKVMMGLTKSPRQQTLERMTFYFQSLKASGFIQTSVSGTNVPVDGSDRARLTYRTSSCVQEPAYRYKAAETRLTTIREREDFPDDRRTELIDGVVYDMSSPSMLHQVICGMIYSQLSSCIEAAGKPCIAMIAPFDIVLSENPATVLQPDVFVACDKEHFHSAQGTSLFSSKYYGAPPLVIEVLSPSTKKKDNSIKLSRYLDAGVKEYWIVDPVTQKIAVYDLDAMRDEGKSSDLIYLHTFDEKIPVLISRGSCSIDFRLIGRRIRDIMSS